jgi:hypothetical protein
MQSPVNTKTLATLLVFSILFLAAGFVNAQDSLEKIISGFEEKDQSDATSQIDSVIQGFGDETADNQTPQEKPIDSIIEGFEDTDTTQTGTSHQPETASPIDLDGYVKLGATYNFAHDAPESDETDWRGLSRLKPEARMDMEAKVTEKWRLLIGTKLYHDFSYAIKGRDEFSDEVLDAYESEVELAEAWLHGRASRFFDLKAGRQIVVWGRSDNIRITDVLNPLDLREPGMTDIEDLRLPVAMSRVDGYWRAWNLSAIALHEIRFDKSPAFGHDFFPGSTPLPEEDKPHCAGRNSEWALALNGIFSGKDLSLYWADLFDEKVNAAIDPNGQPIREHARVTMWGAAGNLAMGNWLVKSEAAFWQGIKFFNVTQATFERLDGLLGIEYSGWDETTISLDWSIRHTIDFDKRLKSAPDFAQEDAFQSAIRISRNFLNETLNISILGMIYGPLGQDGALERVTVSYDWSDAISTAIGMVLYQSGDKYILNSIDDNDRVFADIKYHF